MQEEEREEERKGFHNELKNLREKDKQWSFLRLIEERKVSDTSIRRSVKDLTNKGIIKPAAARTLRKI